MLYGNTCASKYSSHCSLLAVNFMIICQSSKAFVCKLYIRITMPLVIHFPCHHWENPYRFDSKSRTVKMQLLNTKGMFPGACMSQTAHPVSGNQSMVHMPFHGHVGCHVSPPTSSCPSADVIYIHRKPHLSYVAYLCLKG